MKAKKSKPKVDLEDWSTQKLLRKYQTKAPVCICHLNGQARCGAIGAPWCGPQVEANRVLHALRLRGWAPTDEIKAALSHSLRTKEGRDEFDALMTTEVQRAEG